MNGIMLNPGTLFIGTPGKGLIPFCETKESELIEVVENRDDMKAQNILRIGSALSEVSIAINVSRQAMEEFLMVITGVRQHVLDIMREEGHEKVYHLAVHAKKHRTRKKNFNRARRILAKGE